MRKACAMHLSPRCGAKTRRGTPCRGPAMVNGRCRMHGGTNPGAPVSNKNALKHGQYSAAARAKRRQVAALIQDARRLVEAVDAG